LIQRDDDKEENRHAATRGFYHQQTEPLVAYYQKWSASGDPNAPKYRKVDGTGPVGCDPDESARSAEKTKVDSMLVR